jgi:tetratricopeptide (TPR) repeat protein
MAGLDPYSPCPCGSGQKFKWCCHKVEAIAERAHRLFKGGQIDAAVAALDEGLAKERDNPWLLTRKALYLIQTGRFEDAKTSLKKVLAKSSQHIGAHSLLTRIVLETEGPAEGAAQLQQALTALPREAHALLAGLVRVVATFLAEDEEFPAALKHLELAHQLQPDPDDPGVNTARQTIESNPKVPTSLKNEFKLLPAPRDLAPSIRARFQEAIAWAQVGLWSSAAAAFETLADDPAAGPYATRNLGFCRLWLGDDAAAELSLRRYREWLGPTTEAVDLEALCQQIGSPGPDDLVEYVQLTWPLRNREALLTALRSDPTVGDEGTSPVDPENPSSPAVDQFALFDRPRLETARPDLTAAEIPCAIGRVVVTQDSARLETYDDGRLDRLSERLRGLAGSAIAPAHPRTKVLDKAPRLQVALLWEWVLPENVDDQQRRRLNREQTIRLLGTVWPATPNPALRGRTPLQAASSSDAEVPLRASLLNLSQSRDLRDDGFDFETLRARLHLPPEPSIDPETVDIATLPLERLFLVPVARLNDEKLSLYYARARRYSIDSAVENAALELIRRPEAREKFGIGHMLVYGDLAWLCGDRFDCDTALSWINQGRQADSITDSANNAPFWDMLEIRITMGVEAPEKWVPELAAVLERYRDNPNASQLLMTNLMEMRLIEVAPDPDRRGEFLLDTRRLQALLSKYGPRVTTASGRVGVSATKADIWTPGASTGGSGGLWTPGSSTAGASAAPGGEKKLILPGR